MNDAVVFWFLHNHVLTEFRNDMVARTEYLLVHVCVILYIWSPAERKTRVGTLTKDNYNSGKIIPNFLVRGFLT